MNLPFPAITGTLQWKGVLSGFLVPLLLMLGYYVVGGFDTGAQEPTGDIVTVQRRTITRSIKATGTVALANEQQLRFNVLGEVEKVHVQEGDTVERDQLIAELDKTDPLADVRQAALSVNDASLRLQDLEASRAQQILSAQNAVSDTQRNLEEAQGKLPSQQQSVENAIEQAERTVREKEMALQKSYHDLAASVADTMTSVDSLLDDLLGVLLGSNYIRGATRNPSFDIAFQFNNYDLKNQVEFAYYEAVNAYDALLAEHGDIVNIVDIHQLQSALSDAVAMTQEVKKLTDIAYDFTKTAVPSADYTDADINTLKSTVNAARTKATSLIETLRNQQATLTGDGTNTAQQALEKAQEDLAVLIAQQENGVTTADTQQRTIANLSDSLDIKREQLDQTLKSVDISINQQRNTLAQRQVALQKSQRSLESYELRAPFAGVVRRIDFQVGDNLLADASETKYVVLENPDFFIVTVELDQVDVINVREGQKAIITFDALPDETFEGTVDIIDTTPIQTSGVVSYAVKIELPPTSHTILSGMTAKVEIEIASSENVVAVPNLAIQKQNERSFVTGADGSRIPIETGVTDGSYTEVLSGLAEGDQIQSVSIALDAAASTDTDANARRMMMGGMGGPPR